MSVFHNLQIEGQVHQIHNFEYANAAARTGATGFVASDVHKIALQTDNNTFWVLTAITPTWVAISGSASSITFLSLTDTPSSYAGQENQLVGVNTGATALEFKNPNLHTLTDAVTTGFTNIVTVAHNSSGTPAAGFGTGIGAQAESSTTNDTLIGGIHWVWRVATHASRLSQVNLVAYNIANPLLVGRIAASTSTVTTPNAIGDGAVDLQPHKTNANEVAGGAYTFLGAGNSNLIGTSVTASGVVAGTTNIITGSISDSFIGAGISNTIDADTSGIIGGDSNIISAALSFIGGGLDNDVAGGGSSGIIAGNNNAINTINAVIVGGHHSIVAAGAQSSMIMGEYGHAIHRAELVLGGGPFSQVGDAQTMFIPLRRSVTHSDTAWYELYIDGLSEQLAIPSSDSWTFEALIIGTSNDNIKTFSFKILGAIENDAGTTALLGTPTVTTIYDGDDVSFDVRATADDTNDALLIEVTDSDGAGDTVRWVANVKIVSVTSA